MQQLEPNSSPAVIDRVIKMDGHIHGLQLTVSELQHPRWINVGAPYGHLQLRRSDRGNGIMLFLPYMMDVCTQDENETQGYQRRLETFKVTSATSSTTSSAIRWSG